MMITENRSIEKTGITRKQAHQIFLDHDLSIATFDRRLRSGAITSYRQPDGIQLFPEAEVRAATQRIIVDRKGKRKTSQRKAKPVEMPLTGVTLHPITVEAMPDLAPVIHDTFGSAPNVARWQELIREHPNLGVILQREDTQQIVGCGFDYLHTEKKIQHILESEITPPTRTSDLLSPEAGQRVHLYLRTYGIIPTATRREKRHWAMLLVRHLTRYLEDLGKQGVILEKIWSRSETKDGINILRHAGFTQVKSKTSYRNYMIDVPLSGLPICERYEHAYQEYLRQHSGEVG